MIDEAKLQGNMLDFFLELADILHNNMHISGLL